MLHGIGQACRRVGQPRSAARRADGHFAGGPVVGVRHGDGTALMAGGQVPDAVSGERCDGEDVAVGDDTEGVPYPVLGERLSDRVREGRRRSVPARPGLGGTPHEHFLICRFRGPRARPATAEPVVADGADTPHTCL